MRTWSFLESRRGIILAFIRLIFSLQSIPFVTPSGHVQVLLPLVGGSPLDTGSVGTSSPLEAGSVGIPSPLDDVGSADMSSLLVTTSVCVSPPLA